LSRVEAKDVDDWAKSVVEAALFAAGRALSLKEISELTGLSPKVAKLVAEDLAKDYNARESGLEIREFEDRYVMQVRAEIAEKVSKIAPKELEAPLLRTLAIIAYNQPINQSDLARIRGSKSYAHVKELEEMGLIRAEAEGRTKRLTTTKSFADYFGLDFDDPEFVKKVMKGNRKLGVTPMYESLARRMGLEFVVANPYKPYKNDIEMLKKVDVLVISPGYEDRAREHYSGEMIEAGVRTFTQLKESVAQIEEMAGFVDRVRVATLIEEIDSLLAGYKEQAKAASSINPLTPMIEEIALDLGIPTDESGKTAAPDYAKMDAQIQVPTHQPYDIDIVERIKERYEVLLKGSGASNTTQSD